MPKSEISCRYGARFRRGKYSTSSQFELVVLLLFFGLLMICMFLVRTLQYF